MMADNTKTHTDIKSGGRVEQILPEAARPYAVLARLDRPIGWWLLLLPGWWAIMLAGGGVFALNRQDWYVFALFWIGAVVMRAAGCVINDLWDRGLDQKVERTRLRPLASGAVNTRQALIFLAGLLAAGLAVLLQMNFITILLGFLAVPLVILYPLAKRVTWWPQAVLGLVFNFGALMGWSAVSGAVGLPALLLYIGGIFWTLGYDTVYAHQDKEDDLLAGVKSLAIKLGPQSKKWVQGFYAAALALFVLAGIAGAAGFLFYLFIMGAAGQVVWQMRRWSPGDQESSLRVFKSNRDFGLLVLAACALA